jgi:hypothetical protein
LKKSIDAIRPGIVLDVTNQVSARMDIRFQEHAKALADHATADTDRFKRVEDGQNAIQNTLHSIQASLRHRTQAHGD